MKNNVTKLKLKNDTYSEINEINSKDSTLYNEYIQEKLHIFNNGDFYSKTSKGSIGGSMDENKLLEKYLDKVDQDRRDQEERLSKAVIESEKRNHTERIEFEKRINEDRKASEERLEKKFDQILNSIEKNNKDFESKINKLEDKIDSNNKWIIGVCITTVLSIAALVVSILI